MSVIDSYLDTLFAPYADSDAMREARTELRAMMEDKQQPLLSEGLSESQAVGQVIAEFGSLEEVAPVLGIETELSDPGEAGPNTAPTAADDEPQPPPRLELDRARRYAHAVSASQYLTAIAVPLFVLAPTPLLALLHFDDEPGWTTALGLMLVLVGIAIGVVLLHVRGTRLREIGDDIVDQEFRLGPDVQKFAQGLRSQHRRTGSRSLGAAVVLWILAAAPLLFSAFAVDNVELLGLIGTLVMVAAGLFIWIRSAAAEWASETLLKEEEEIDLESSSSTAVRVIASVFWLVVVAIFLVWGLGFDGWDRAWIVFPIAGVLYAALWAANSAIGSDRNSQQERSSR